MRRVTDPARWDEAARALPRHHVLQSWAWGEFKARWGWRPTRLLWDDEAPRAAAQLLRRAIPRTPLGIGYVPKGPLLAEDDPALVDRVLGDLESEARRLRCLFVKIDPDVEADNAVWVDALRRRGWEPGEPIQFPNTGTLDLRPDEDALLAAMKSKTRYNVRLAERRGVEVRSGGAPELERFFELYAETAARDGFLIRPREYYLDLWRDFVARGLAHPLLAWVEDEAVAGLILFRYGCRAWYMYGASSDRHRNLMPNYSLQWAAIRWARGEGLTEYDWWGAPDDPDDPDDPLAGVWRFKQGFDARFRPQIGAWDYPTTSLGYRAYTGLLPRVLSMARGFAGGAAGQAGG